MPAASHGSAPTPPGPSTGQEDRHLRRDIGYWQLTAIGFSGVIGSGWLLGAL